MTDLNNRMEEIAKDAQINDLQRLKLEQRKLKTERADLENNLG